MDTGLPHKNQSASAAAGDPAAALDIRLGCHLLLRDMGVSALNEVTLKTARRVDMMALHKSGEIWVIEIKSSINDFRSDQKWPGYLDYADQFFFAVAPDFPTGILPENTGLIVADRYGAAIMRDAPKHKLPTARRKQLIQTMALVGARRLSALEIAAQQS